MTDTQEQVRRAAGTGAVVIPWREATLTFASASSIPVTMNSSSYAARRSRTGPRRTVSESRNSTRSRSGWNSTASLIHGHPNVRRDVGKGRAPKCSSTSRVEKSPCE